jgi:iron complex outermembrane recepter protein
MSNSTNTKSGGSRSRLLATVSAMALVASVCAAEPAVAGQPPLWFELGWNFENIRISDSNLALPLGPLVPQSGLTAPLTNDFGFSRSYTSDGTITFKPDGSDWVFAASIRYGRSRGSSQKLNQALAPIPTTSLVTYQRSIPAYSYRDQHRVKHLPISQEKLSEDGSSAEAHFIVDFEAGKDIGLGMFGRGSTSTLSAGVRFAHFTTSRKASNFQETQGIHFQSSHFTGLFYSYFPSTKTKRRELWNAISANGSTSQNFNGLGPSIQWDASAQLWGDSQGALSLDWGVNAAFLFGKQKIKIEHQTTSHEHCVGDGCPAHPTVLTSGPPVSSSKSTTVPNVGGFAGISLDYKDVKVSLGYRADLFVNAIDVGFATRKSSNLLLHGPFASLSIGVGD